MSKKNILFSHHIEAKPQIFVQEWAFSKMSLVPVRMFSTGNLSHMTFKTLQEVKSTLWTELCVYFKNMQTLCAS